MKVRCKNNFSRSQHFKFSFALAGLVAGANIYLRNYYINRNFRTNKSNFNLIQL